MKTHGYFQNTASFTVFIKYRKENTVLQEENATKESEFSLISCFYDYLITCLFNDMLIFKVSLNFNVIKYNYKNVFLHLSSAICADCSQQ